MTRKKRRAGPRRAAPRDRRPGKAPAKTPWRRDRRLLAALAVSPLLLLAWIAWMVAGPGPASRDGGSTDVVLPAGAHLPAIAADLSRAGVIGSDLLFIVTAKLTGAAARLQAGEYDIPSATPLWRVLGMLRAGAVVHHVVTIPEGVAAKAVVDILERCEVLSGPAPTPPEGAVLPATYQVRRGETRAQVLAEMMQARDKLLDQLWRERAPELPYDSPGQAVTLASIVEKETAKPAERPLIAGLFVNRLRVGMRLESDPTVIYGLTGGEPLGHGLRASELASATPYNTYRVAGLPPTPIANPGRAALEAALRPARTDDLYFVADGTGGHVFAATWADHLRNVAHWRAIEKSRAATPTSMSAEPR